MTWDLPTTAALFGCHGGVDRADSPAKELRPRSASKGSTEASGLSPSAGRPDSASIRHRGDGCQAASRAVRGLFSLGLASSRPPFEEVDLESSPSRWGGMI